MSVRRAAIPADANGRLRPGEGRVPLRRDTNGLVMIAATLLLAAAAVVLVVHNELHDRRDVIHDKGSALANALARIPLEELAPEGRALGPLSLLRASMHQPGFEYAFVVEGNGSGARIAASVGAIPETAPLTMSSDPSRWTFADDPQPGHGGGTVDFAAPVLDQGRLAGHVHIGFRQPTMGDVLFDLPVLYWVVLLFVLTLPLSHAWLRREIRPLRAVASRIEAEGDDPAARHVDSKAPTEAISAIAARVQALQETMAERSDTMARERVALMASSRATAHEKNRLQVLVQSLPDAVLALDETGRVALANTRAETLLHKQPGELAGQSLRAWCPSDELARRIGRYTSGSARLMRSESVLLANGELGHRHFEAGLHPRPEGDGLVVVLRDVTAIQAEREAQAEFLAHMAHELKAPLNVIAMYSESLLGEESADEAFRIDACNVIHDEVDRLNGLINNIFSIGRIESGHVSLDRQRVRTRDLLEDVFQTVSRGDNELGLEFVLELPDSMQPIFADKQLFSVALNNLLTNAIKYNCPEGRVTLSAEEHDEGLLIRVADTGLGIPEEDIERVFEKFYRSDDETARKVTGHGLGLSLVKEIISLHGGEIRVSSVLGEGSEFSFFFDRNAALFREED